MELSLLGAVATTGGCSSVTNWNPKNLQNVEKYQMLALINFFLWAFQLQINKQIHSGDGDCIKGMTPFVYFIRIP